MATIIGESIRNRVYSNGSHGNFSLAHGRHSVKSAESGDVVNLLEFEIGIKVFGVRVCTDAGMGTGITAKVKLGEKVLASGVDVSTGIAKAFPVTPYPIPGNETLSVELSGGIATGDINVILEYVAEGH